MNFNENDMKYYMKSLLKTPSPSGYTDKITKSIIEELKKIGVNYTTTNKGAVIATIKGINDDYQKTLSAHADTLGAMIRELKPNGSLGIVPIGGFMMTSIDGENCIVHTLGDKSFSGTIQNIKPSVHISGDEARDLKKTPENMEIILDEKVFSKIDVENLGINVGDFVSFDARTVFTEKGFIKSRHLDDKAGTAMLLYTIKYIVKNNLKLPNTTNFFISNYEEVGHGASAGIPEKTKEFISVDMGAPGLTQNSSEYAVCICANDSTGPYDYQIRKDLINLCTTNNISYKIDVYPHYGSDASAARVAGYDIKAGLIGPGVFASHAYERTHIDSIIATIELVIQYCLQKK